MKIKGQNKISLKQTVRVLIQVNKPESLIHRHSPKTTIEFPNTMNIVGKNSRGGGGGVNNELN